MVDVKTQSEIEQWKNSFWNKLSSCSGNKTLNKLKFSLQSIFKTIQIFKAASQ